MAFWLIPQYTNFFLVPLSSISNISDTQENLIDQPKREQQNKELRQELKLNICEQDLLKAGYNHKRSSWTEEEDKILLQLAKTENLNWNQIGKKMSNRNSKMCYSRYRRLSYETKKRWSAKEETLILNMIENNGFNWKKIASQIPGRTARQIEQHYHFCLRPDLNKSEWTLQEDLFLINLLEAYGTNWKIIQQKMVTRSQNQIKNRYFGRFLKIISEKEKKSIKKCEQKFISP